jgi:hypothetical protein
LSTRVNADLTEGVEGCGGRIDLIQAVLKFTAGVDRSDVYRRERSKTDRDGVSTDLENELGESVVVSRKLVVEGHLDTSIDVVESCWVRYHTAMAVIEERVKL